MKILRIIIATIIHTIKANIGLKKHGESIYYENARKWSAELMDIAGIKLEVFGRSNIDKNETYIFVSNHSDLFDIPILHCAIENDFRIIYKKELEKVPIFGKGLERSPYIGVVRENPQKAMKSVENAIKSAGEGRSVLVFPEGTRTKTGAVGQFKRGGFMIAARAGKPVVPVAVKGTYGISTSSKFAIKGADVKVMIGEPIYQSSHNSQEEKKLMIEVKERIEKMLLKL